MDNKNVYRSNIGIIYFLVSFIIAAILVRSFLYIRGDGSAIAIYIAYIIAAILYYFALIRPIFNTEYILLTDRLSINCGMYKNEIMYKDILDVYKKNSFGRQPSLSQKMVFISYNDCGAINSVGISPENQDEFIGEIQNKIKNLTCSDR